MTTTTLRLLQSVAVKQAQPDTCFYTYGWIDSALDGGGLSGNHRLAYLSFGSGIPLGVTISSAILRFKTMATDGPATLKLVRINGRFVASETTYNARITEETGPTVQASKAAAVPNLTEWTMDVTAIAQEIANGATWTTLKLYTTDSRLVRVYNERSAVPPTLELTYSVKPAAPTNLLPADGGRVSTPTPVVRWQSGELIKARIQIATSSSFATIEKDVTVNTTAKQLDLSTIGWAGIPEGSPRSWRVMISADGIVWSDWSLTQWMVYRALPTIAMVRPSAANPTITDPTPTFEFSYSSPSSSPQHAFQIKVWHLLPDGSRDRLMLMTPWQYTAATTYTPDVAFGDQGSYLLELSVLDSHSRTVTPGAGIYARTSLQFSYAYSSTVPVVQDLRAAGDGIKPGITVSWVRNDEIDQYALYRDDELLRIGAPVTFNDANLCWIDDFEFGVAQKPTPVHDWDEPQSGAWWVNGCRMEQDATWKTSGQHSAKVITTNGSVRSFINYQGIHLQDASWLTVAFDLRDAVDTSAVHKVTFWDGAGNRLDADVEIPVVRNARNLLHVPVPDRALVAEVFVNVSQKAPNSDWGIDTVVIHRGKTDGLPSARCTFVDPYPDRGRDHVYRVVPMQTILGPGMDSGQPAEVTARDTSRGTWLVQGPVQVCIHNDKDSSTDFSEDVGEFTPVGSDHAIIVQGTMRGYAGTISGTLDARVLHDYSELELRDNLMLIKQRRTKPARLILPDRTFMATVYQIQCTLAPDGGQYRVEVRYVALDHHPLALNR